MIRKHIHRPPKEKEITLAKSWYGRLLDNRRLVVFSLLVGLVGTAVLLGSHADNPVATDGNVGLALSSSGTPFASSSFWNTLLPDNTPVNPNNTQYINEIGNQLCTSAYSTTAPNLANCTVKTNTDTASLDSSQWSGPLYVVPADQPLVPVINYCGHGDIDQNMGDSNWVSTNWTTTTTSATHTTGNTSPLINNQSDAVPTYPYQVSFTFSGNPADGSSVTVSTGESINGSTHTPYVIGTYTFTPSQDNFTVTKVITVPSGDYSTPLTFTPSADFDGTISAVTMLPYNATFNSVVAGGIPIPADAHGSGESNVPNLPVITSSGTLGTTDYEYSVAAITASGTSEPTPSVDTYAGNATLSSTNYNTVNWTPVAGASQYKIYRTFSGGTPSSVGLIATVNDTGSGQTQTFNDTGIAATTAAPSPDTDREITIYQPSTDKEWEFWQFQKDFNGNQMACVGGVINNVSTSSGIFPSGTGSTAAGLPLLGGIPRIEEFQAGAIDHVMNLTLQFNFFHTGTSPNYTVPANITDPGNKAYSWPANRNDGGSSDTLAIPEGQRFRLPANLDLSQFDPSNPNATTPLTPMAYTIAVAAQKYGFVVDDSSETVNIRIGDPTTYTQAGLPNPYSTGVGVGGVNDGNKGLLDGKSFGAILAGFPWQDLQALPFNYGEPDTTPPTVSVSSPTAGATMTGNVSISATASDNIGLDKVQFKLDGNNLGSAIDAQTAGPYTYSWDTTGISNGTHTLTAVATDLAGNTTTSSPVSVTVSNASLPMDGNVGLSIPSAGTPFAADSFWNTLLPSNPGTNPNSAGYVNLVTNQVANSNNGVIETSRWSNPVYVVPANQPLVSVTSYCADGRSVGSGFNNTIVGSGVPIPSDAHGAGGTDEHVSFYQPSTNKLWEFWQFQSDGNGGWEACWGGEMNNVSTSNGVFTYPFGGWTTGLAQLGAVVRIEELQSGNIDHAIGIGLANLLSAGVIPANTPQAVNGISWPANRSDGTNTDDTAIPEGTRFQLDPNLDLSQFHLTPVAYAIAVAAQKYGFVVAWTGPTNANISLGDPTTYTTAGLPNPYTSGEGVGGVNDGNLGLFDGISQTQIMNNFPWSDLKALPFNYGEGLSPTTTPPDTTISSTPASSTTSTSATFQFSGTDNLTASGNLTFQCKLDNGSFNSCGPGSATYNNLSVGSHTFQVRAIDGQANSDPAPPSFTWTVTSSTPIVTGDLDGDGHVTGHDLSLFLAHYGTNYPSAEFDGSPTVEGHDLSILLSNYGK